MKNNLIAVSGRIGSGKDTVGKILQYLSSFNKYSNSNIKTLIENYNAKDLYPHFSNYQIKKYADKLKDIVCLLIGCDREELEDRKFKEKELGEEWWKWEITFEGNFEGYIDYVGNEKHYEDEYMIESHLIKLTPRKLLQLLGTEEGREILHPNIWVNALFADYQPLTDITTSNIYRDDRLQHGYKNTRIWRAYHNIKQRCNNPKHPRYNDYGGRGITMCDEWSNSIESFINWAKEKGYNDNLTIDRIDNDGGYSPNNCRVVTYSVQSTNTKTRKDNSSGYRGVSKDKHGWRASIQINKKRKFLGYFNTAEQASESYEEAFLERENLYLEENKTNLIYPSWLVTDVRFPNEAQAIKDRGGIIVRVNRGGFNITDGKEIVSNVIETDDLRGYDEFVYQDEASVIYRTSDWERVKEHHSETALDDYEFDHVIDNDRSIEELVEKVKQLKLV